MISLQHRCFPLKNDCLPSIITVRLYEFTKPPKFFFFSLAVIKTGEQEELHDIWECSLWATAHHSTPECQPSSLPNWTTFRFPLAPVIFLQTNLNQSNCHSALDSHRAAFSNTDLYTYDCNPPNQYHHQLCR